MQMAQISIKIPIEKEMALPKLSFWIARILSPFIAQWVEIILGKIILVFIHLLFHEILIFRYL